MTAENPVVAIGGTATPDFRDSNAPRLVGWFSKVFNAPYSIQMNPPEPPPPPQDNDSMIYRLRAQLKLFEMRESEERMLFGRAVPETVDNVARLEFEISTIR